MKKTVCFLGVLMMLCPEVFADVSVTKERTISNVCNKVNSASCQSTAVGISNTAVKMKNRKKETQTALSSMDNESFGGFHQAERLETQLSVKQDSVNVVDNSVQANNARHRIGAFYLGVAAGAAIAKIGESQFDDTNKASDELYQYTGAKYHSAPILSVHGGYEFDVGNYLLSVGVGAYDSMNNVAKGDRIQIDSSGTYKRADYEYQAASFRVMAEMQLGMKLAIKKVEFYPFLSLGIGPAFNSVSDYGEEPVASTEIPDVFRFKSHTTCSFAYQIGGGVSIPVVSDSNRLSLGYLFADLGKGHFNDFANPNYTTYHLGTGRIHNNEVYMSYTHLF